MGKVKNWMMDIEEFCDEFFCGGDSEYTVEEVADFAKSHFHSKLAGDHAKEYIEKTLGEM
jgi:hypothetical protein